MSSRLTQISEDEVCVEINGRRIYIPAYCPHRGGKLVFAFVNEKRMRVSCPLHYSAFDLTTGEVTAGPACRGITVALQRATEAEQEG